MRPTVSANMTDDDSDVTQPIPLQTMAELVNGTTPSASIIGPISVNGPVTFPPRRTRRHTMPFGSRIVSRCVISVRP